MRFADDMDDSTRLRLLKSCFTIGGIGEAYKTGNPERLAEAYGEFVVSYIQDSGGGVNENKLKTAALKVVIGCPRGVQGRAGRPGGRRAGALSCSSWIPGFPDSALGSTRCSQSLQLKPTCG
jgi:hypothetical protein